MSAEIFMPNWVSLALTVTEISAFIQRNRSTNGRGFIDLGYCC